MVINSVSWADERHLLLSEDTRLVKVATDGTDAVNLISDPAARIESVAACTENRSVVFSSFFLREKQRSKCVAR